MDEFSSFIFDQGLLDIPLVGGQYTWSNNHCWSRIDRFLLSLVWEEKFPDVVQRRLLCLLSDHSPILLDYRERKRRGGYFKFENM
jgi:endonuclease/exonuclease/phosphatase family metal-dependent hydrolase